MTDIRHITRPDPKLLWQYALSTLALGPCFLVGLVPLYFKYTTLRYRFDDDGVAMSWGLIWRREIYLTYARIQDIHLTRGVVERWLGLGTIEVQTASGKSSAEMAIVGVPEFEALRDYLYARMRGARLRPDGHPGGAASGPGAMGLPGDSAEAIALLTEIRDTVRRIRQRLEAGSS